jgi:hypothetical protein
MKSPGWCAPRNASCRPRRRARPRPLRQSPLLHGAQRRPDGLQEHALPQALRDFRRAVGGVYRVADAGLVIPGNPSKPTRPLSVSAKFSSARSRSARISGRRYSASNSSTLSCARPRIPCEESGPLASPRSMMAEGKCCSFRNRAHGSVSVSGSRPAIRSARNAATASDSVRGSIPRSAVAPMRWLRRRSPVFRCCDRPENRASPRRKSC